MIRGQHLSELQVVCHAVTEETTGKHPSFAPHRDDAAMPGAARSGELPREPQPSGQVNRHDRLTDQWKNRPDLVTREQIDSKVRHNSPADSGKALSCTTGSRKSFDPDQWG